MPLSNIISLNKSQSEKGIFGKSTVSVSQHEIHEDGNSLDDSNSSIVNSGKEIGVISAIFLIINRMIGTGIFATPANIYKLSGSVGAALFMWVAGSLIAAAGLMVYLEWGTAIPKNGGEKNYLQFFYRKPTNMMLSMYASYAFLAGSCASNSVVFGEYILSAAGVEPGRWNQRGIAIACVTFSLLVNSVSVKAGLLLQNLLGSFKFVLVCIITVAGFVALGGGVKGLSSSESKSHFDNAFSGPNSPPSAYGIVMALYSVIYSYIGYSNANYALGETKNPVRTLKIAAPLALGLVSVIYLLVNIAFFAAVPHEELLSSGRVVAASFFRIVFGESAQKGLSACVALSALGNVLAVLFTQGRVVQELGKEGILPFSKFFASHKPFKSPMTGMFEQWVASVVVILAPPPGDAYNFILNFLSYPLALVNTLISVALIIINFNREKYDWNPPIRATFPVTLFFGLSSLYLLISPLVPPTKGQNVYESLPYWLHCLGILIFIGGGFWWALRFHILPRIFPNHISKELKVYTEDGREIVVKSDE